MKKLPASIAVTLGAAMIAGPWVWAWLAVRENPSLADAQGAWSLATYLSFITVPVGLYMILSSSRK